MRVLLAIGALALLAVQATTAQPLLRPFPFVMPSYDSLHSDYLPDWPREHAGANGFLRVSDDGHFAIGEAARARFFGVTLAYTAAFPDSLGAIALASRLRKLGVNLVRFVYFDYYNWDGASVLAPGQRSDTLSPAQMRRLDWLVYSLRTRGIYTHIVLKTRNRPRRDDGVPGWDSTYNYGMMLQFFSAPMRAMQKRYADALFNHINPFTRLRYADDPAVALVTLVDQATPWYYWLIDYLNARSGVMSSTHSSMIDSLFTRFLARRYGTTERLRTAWFEGIGGTGLNIISNPGFESFTDDWELVVGEGAQAGLVIVQGTEADSSNGPSSLRAVVRSTAGVESRIYLQQTGRRVRQSIYRLRFRARTDSAAGRPLRVVMIRSVPSTISLGLDTTFAIAGAWQTYTATFRAPLADSLSATLRFYLGRSSADLFLDDVVVEETGRDGLLPGETLESSNVGRPRFSESTRRAARRMTDLGEFYDSAGTEYFADMAAHLRTLGVRAPIASTNLATTSVEARMNSAHDFTSESGLWDYYSARTGLPYSDSTWVMRNYSILSSRDQKIPELAKGSFAGKPFVADYGHVYPNAYRAEAMLFGPAYAALQDWDGLSWYNHTSSSAELSNRRRALGSDSWQIADDPAMMTLMPHAAAMIREARVAPARRMISIAMQPQELRELPLTYYITAGNAFNTDGAIAPVATMVHALRYGDFESSRHYTAADYFFTVPEDDFIESDTREIVRDATRSTMTLNTPTAQGGSGIIAEVSRLQSDNLSVTWLDGARNATWLWSAVDGHTLDSARRSLLTIATRSVNDSVVWQFGDSSIGKRWGVAPTLLEGITLRLNFSTPADSLVLLPLDSMARPTGRLIHVPRASGNFSVVLDIGAEKTPWFGVRQYYPGDPAEIRLSEHDAITVIGPEPNPVTDRSSVRVNSSRPVRSGGRMVDALGRTVHTWPFASGTRRTFEIDRRRLPAGSYIVVLDVDGTRRTLRTIVR